LKITLLESNLRYHLIRINRRISSHKMLEYITKDEESEITWKFRQIASHEVPTQGSQYDLLIEWENGEITTEPLKVIAADDPVTCAIYARENGLLDQPG
jgi:hypothetical protein